jgi:hypothetical protein
MTISNEELTQLGPSKHHLNHHEHLLSSNLELGYDHDSKSFSVSNDEILNIDMEIGRECLDRDMEQRLG